jgi:hypothetical protein
MSPDDAARRIQRAFVSHREAALFQLIRTEMRRIEYSDGASALSKLAPGEARLLSDPALHARVRLRLGGASFPPQVYYRVYTASSTQRLDGALLEAEPRALHSVRAMMGLAKFQEIHADLLPHGPTATAARRPASARGPAVAAAAAPVRRRAGRVDGWQRLSQTDRAYVGLHLAHEARDIRAPASTPGSPRPLSWQAKQEQALQGPARLPCAVSVRRTAQGGTYGYTGHPAPSSGVPLRFASALTLHHGDRARFSPR